MGREERLERAYSSQREAKRAVGAELFPCHHCCRTHSREAFEPICRTCIASLHRELAEAREAIVWVLKGNPIDEEWAQRWLDRNKA